MNQKKTIDEDGSPSCHKTREQPGKMSKGRKDRRGRSDGHCKIVRLDDQHLGCETRKRVGS